MPKALRLTAQGCEALQAALGSEALHHLTPKAAGPGLLRHRAGIVRKLLEAGADTNIVTESGETALMAAAIKGHVEIGRLFLEHGAVVNAQTTEGTTDLFMTSPPVVTESALHFAAAYASQEFVELLLANGANKRLKDHSGQMPANWTGRYHKNDLLDLLR